MFKESTFNLLTSAPDRKRHLQALALAFLLVLLFFSSLFGLFGLLLVRNRFVITAFLFITVSYRCSTDCLRPDLRQMKGSSQCKADRDTASCSSIDMHGILNCLC